jgi:hypothetical protein
MKNPSPPTPFYVLILKNEIAVDVVSIGEIDDNQEKLEEFVKTVDKNNNRSVRLL